MKVSSIDSDVCVGVSVCVGVCVGGDGGVGVGVGVCVQVTVVQLLCASLLCEVFVLFLIKEVFGAESEARGTIQRSEMAKCEKQGEREKDGELVE